MKKLLAMILCAAMALPLIACGAAGGDDTTAPEETEPAVTVPGGYQLDETRNEAIVNDGGVVTKLEDGNARVYYQIFVGSFSDSNGDGIGDLRGIINRFDYLNDGDPNSGVSLGVEGIWLSPIFTSPSYHKYDVTNYYEIDPQFGTMEDLQELIDLCHERGVQIILDLVINHTSRANKWYQEFVYAHQKGNTDSPYYDFYTWSDEKTAGATWYPMSGSDKFYEGNFSSEMPELNFDNEDVKQAVVDVAKFYLDMGVDGFRFDAAKYIYYGDEPANADFWIWYMAELRKMKPDIYTVAEVWDGDALTFPYFASTNCFNFSMSQVSGKIAAAAKGGNVNTLMSYVDNYIKSIREQKEDAMMVTFIANHDMDRAAGFLMTYTGHAYMAANLSILMPGSSYIYYGEEIGMLGSRGSANTDANRRLAMLWGDGDTVKDPVGANYSAEQANGTVVEQWADGTSLYNHYKKLITIRKANPEIAYGEFTPLKTTGKTGGFLCTYNGSTVAVLHNPTTEEVVVDLSAITDVPLTVLAAYVGLGKATLEGTTLTIGAQTSVVLR